METIYLIIRESVNDGVLKFIGYFLMVSLFISLPIKIIEIILNFIFDLINRVLRHKNIKKHGYPPTHCDADGDFIDDTKNNK